MACYARAMLCTVDVPFLKSARARVEHIKDSWLVQVCVHRAIQRKHPYLDRCQLESMKKSKKYLMRSHRRKFPRNADSNSSERKRLLIFAYSTDQQLTGIATYKNPRPRHEAPYGTFHLVIKD